MGYLGLTPTTAQQTYLNVDDISGSFNGSTTSFALLVGGVAPSPFPVTNSCLISVGGVVQRPDDSGTEGFRISGGNIIFSSAPGTGEDFFGVVLAGADYLNVGANFPDGTVGVPSITFQADTDTGIYRGGSGIVSIASNGVAAGSFSSTGFSAVAGTVGAPAISTITDTNTGIYFPAADNIGFVEGGVEALRIDSSGRVGIGTTTFADNNALLHVSKDASGSTGGSIVIRNGAANASGNMAELVFKTSAGFTNGFNSAKIAAIQATASEAADLAFYTYGAGLGTERARIDSSGRLLVGTSSTSASARAIVQGGGGGAGDGGPFMLARVNSTPNSGDELGILEFSASNHVAAARIFAARDGGTWTSGSSQPSRLVFSTTADGASSPTERMRITAKGNALFNTTSNTLGSSNPVSAVFNHVEGTSDHVVSIVASTASFASGALLVGCYRSANSAYRLAGFYSGDGSTVAFSDQEFSFRGDGNGYCDGAWTGGGADYAEYFEWSDGNPDEDDRRGISVVLDGDKIRPAVDGEDPIGVISGNPSVVGDAAWNKWNGKYLRDDYGSYILDEDGNRQLNPAYDPDQEYVNREDRPEWDCVGLMGKLRIRKGQPTGSRWIKMRDISDSVEEWLVR